MRLTGARIKRGAAAIAILLEELRLADATTRPGYGDLFTPPGLVDGARRGFRNRASAVDAARRSDHRSLGRSNRESSSSGFKETVS